MPVEAKEYFRRWFQSLTPTQRRGLAAARTRQTLHDDGLSGAAAASSTHSRRDDPAGTVSSLPSPSPSSRPWPSPSSAVDPAAFMGLIKFHSRASLPSLASMFRRLSFVVTQVNAVFLSKRLLQTLPRFAADAGTSPPTPPGEGGGRAVDLQVLIAVNLSLSLAVAALKLCFGVANLGGGAGGSSAAGEAAPAAIAESDGSGRACRDDDDHHRHHHHHHEQYHNRIGNIRTTVGFGGGAVRAAVATAAAGAEATATPVDYRRSVESHSSPLSSVSSAPPSSLASSAPSSAPSSSSRFLGSFIMLSVYLALTPVLLTLTEPYADDTVGILVGLFLALHLFSHDYFPQGARASPGAVSLNAGVVATVLLASRLDSVLPAFFGIALGIAVVEGVPRLRDTLWRRDRRRAGALFTTAALLSSAAHAALLWCDGGGGSGSSGGGARWWEPRCAPDADSAAAAAAFVAVLLAFWVACPALYRSLHRHKIVISGPWDIAHVRSGQP